MKKFRGFLIALTAAIALCAGLFAAACGNTVTLTFRSNGGPDVPPIENVEKGSTVTLPSPSRDNFAFEGWYIEEGGELFYGSVPAPDKDTTYTASWAAGYLLTLNLGGGAMDGGTSFYLAEGQNIADFLKDKTPTRGEFAFGGWFEGNTALSSSRKMPAAPLTLTAKYRVGYTVEIWLQNFDLTEYERSSSRTVTAEGLLGETVSAPALTVTGFERDAANNGQPDSVVLGETASSNLIRLYYNRRAFTVAYEANAPAGVAAQGRMESAQVVYGGTHWAMPCGFTVPGYRFAGWSDLPGGEVKYLPDEPVPVEKHVTLYAVWDRGYQDRFGSLDLVYFPRGEEGTAILSRSGVEFRGTCSGDSFEFVYPNGKLQGRVYPITAEFPFPSFVYLREALAGTYTFYNPYRHPDIVNEEQRFHRDTTLVIRDDQSAVYTEPVEGKTVSVSGTVTAYNPDVNEYIFTTSSEYEDAFLFRLGEVNGEDVFEMSQNEGGMFIQFLSNGSSYAMSNGLIELDGFGNILYMDDTFNVSEAVGSYYIDKFYESPLGEPIYSIVSHVEETGVSGEILFSADLNFYTTFLYDSTYGQIPAYIVQSGYAATYTGQTADGKAVRFTLDGYGGFDDSAVLTIGGEEYAGTYSIEEPPLNDAVVTIYIWSYESGAPEVAQSFRFALTGLDAESKTGTCEEAVETDYTAYFWLHYASGTPVLDTPPMLLLLYETPVADDPDVLRAEIAWVGGDNALTTVATGSYSVDTLGTNAHGVRVYTFTLGEVTEAGGDYRVYLPQREFKFLVNALTNGNTDFNVYYLLEQDGQPLYEVLHDRDGKSEEIRYAEFGVPSVGSLYFDAQGNVYEGDLSVTENYWGDSVGAFRWTAGTYYDYFYFDLGLNANGEFIDFAHYENDQPPEETAMFQIDAQGTMNTDVTFILYSNGNGLYSPSGDFSTDGSVTRGVCEETGFTDFDASPQQLYTFYETESGNKTPQFRFVCYPIQYLDYDGWITIYVYRIYDDLSQAVAGEYAGEDGSTLVLDGIRFALYTDSDGVVRFGEYSMNADGSATRAAYFTASDGETFIFELQSGNRFGLLDAAFGVYLMEDSTGAYTFDFDGRGVLTYRVGGGNNYPGRYIINSEEDSVECTLFIDLQLGHGTESFVVLLQNGRCIRRDEKAQGVFLDADWNILKLDGYGGAVLYASDGGSEQEGYFFSLGETDGKYYGFVRFEDFTEIPVSFDWEEHTFEIAVSPDRRYVYYTSDFSMGIVYGTDSFTYIGNNSGFTFVDKETGTVTVWISDVSGALVYNSFVLPAPGAKSIEYDNQTLYLWNGEEVVMKGVISAAADQPARVESHVTLSFTPDGTTVLNVPATLAEENGNPHSVLFSNFMVQGNVARYLPCILSSGNAYSLFDTFAYLPGNEEESGFTAHFASVVSRLTDDVDLLANPGGNAKVSYMETVYYGFGPIMIDRAQIRGTLNYPALLGGSGEPFTFEADPDDIYVADRDSSNGTRYFLPFEKDGKQYAITYFTPEADYYVLYAVMTYSEFETSDGYSVGVGGFLYANAYSFLRNYGKGDPFYLSLKKDGGYILPYGSGLNHDGSVGWYLARGSYDADTGAGEFGNGYSIALGYGADGAVSSATVAAYEFRQAMEVGQTYAVNFFLDENGDDVVLAALLAYNASDGVYEYVDIVSTEKTAEGTWRIEAADGTSYEVTILYNEDGSHRLFDDEWSWLVNVVPKY